MHNKALCAKDGNPAVAALVPAEQRQLNGEVLVV
jgi:hypothetical protein